MLVNAARIVCTCKSGNNKRMNYVVELERSFRANQGLASPVRRAKGLAAAVPDGGFSVVLRLGITFKESQLTSSGWFVDTDAVEDLLTAQCDLLASKKWTELFDFRPTFELVARQVFRELQADMPQLAYVELENTTLGVTTRFSA